MDSLYLLNTGTLFWIGLVMFSLGVLLVIFILLLSGGNKGGDSGALGGALAFVFGGPIVILLSIGTTIMIASQLTLLGGFLFFLILYSIYVYVSHKAHQKVILRIKLKRKKEEYKKEQYALIKSEEYTSLFTILEKMKKEILSVEEYTPVILSQKIIFNQSEYDKFLTSVIGHYYKCNKEEMNSFLTLFINEENKNGALMDIVKYYIEDENIEEAKKVFLGIKYTSMKENTFENYFCRYYLEKNKLQQLLDFIIFLFDNDIYLENSYRTVVQYILKNKNNDIDVNSEISKILVTLKRINKPNIVINIIYDCETISYDLFILFVKTINLKEIKGYIDTYFLEVAFEYYTEEAEDIPVKELYELLEEEYGLLSKIKDKFIIPYIINITKDEDKDNKEKIKLIEKIIEDNHYRFNTSDFEKLPRYYSSMNSEIYLNIIKKLLSKKNVLSKKNWIIQRIKNSKGFYKDEKYNKEINLIVEKFEKE